MISIIVPIYNVEKYLPRCIESILNQTYKDLEIILVDDGSPDNCGKICDTYAAKDGRIKVIHKKNGGLSSARNAGLELASGEYLMFVDSDDYIDKNAVSVLCKRITEDRSDVVAGKHVDAYDNGKLDGWYCDWMKDAVLSKIEVFTSLAGENYIPVACWGKLFKRNLFDGIKFPPLVYAEDLWIYPLIIDRCKKISVVNQVVYYYFQRNTSIWHVKTEQAKQDDVNVVLCLVEFLLKQGYKSSANKWYEIAIDKALETQNKQYSLSIFSKYFDAKKRKELLKPQSAKVKLKWLCLRVPFLFAMVTKLKFLTGRKA